MAAHAVDDPAAIPLTADQRRLLQARRTTALAGTAAFGAIVLALLGGSVAKLNNPALFSRGEWIVWVPLALLWLWWLAPSLRRLRATQLDLDAGLAASANGELRSEFRMGFGLVQTAKYTLTLGGHRFDVDRATYHQLKQGGRYTVTFAPRSQTLLEAAPLTGPRATAAAGRPSAALAGPDALTVVELKLLRLIAEGRSNKEIAEELSFSVNTIKVYLSTLYAKLDVSRRTEAVARARELHLL